MGKSYIQMLWLAGLGFQVLLLGVLLARRLWTKFPLFLSYVVCGLTTSSALYLVRGVPALYFYAYWILEGIGILLGFGLLFEVFRSLIHPYTSLHRLANVACQATIVFLILLACAVAYIQPSAIGQRLSSAIFVTEEAARVVEVGLLVFLFVFSTAFGLHWRQPVFGIALGLGLFVSVELLGVTVMSRLGAGARDVLSLVRITAFDFSLLIWIGYLLLPEQVTSPAEMPKRAQLEQWNQAIMELINQ